MDIKDIQGALFDLDGVLIDSETVYTEIWSDIDKMFPTGVENFALRIKGTTLQDILDTYFPEELRPDVERYLRQREDDMLYRPFPHVIEFLEYLEAHRIPAAIVTSSNTHKMEHLFSQLPDLRRHFHAFITDSDVTHSKPDPEGYIKAAAALGVPSGRCCVFEDSFAGLAAGRAAGGMVVALATTNPYDSLTPHADMVIRDFSELL